MNLFETWRARLVGRADSEHQQALVRLVILVLVAGYLWIVIRPQGGVARQFQLSFAFLGVEFVVGAGILGWLSWRPAPSIPRRLLGMVADYSLIGIGMHLLGAMLAPLYVLLMWVTIGNGMRFGARWLYVAAAMASATFLAVLLLTPYWLRNPWMAWGLLVGLVAIPLYFNTLLKALTRATEEARAASAAKTRFVATISHELRTPLNGIIGMAELLSTTQMSGEQQDSTRIILTSARALQSLVEDVLDISAIEAGKLHRHDVDFDLPELLEGIRLMVLPSVKAKRLDLAIRLPEELPRQFHGDRGHLSQILLNLLANAVKFTETGSVRLDVAIVSREGDALRMRFSVIDTGIGIPAEAQARIFQVFEQADSGRDRRYGGSGLGTTIALALAQRMGGTIDLDSTEGVGSVFRVELPMRAAALQPGLSPSVRRESGGNVIAFDDPFLRHRASTQPKSIVVVDDQEANVLVLQRLLEKAGHRVRWAAQAEVVLDMLEAGRVDLVITDLHMPEVSGIDLIKQTRFMQAGQKAKTPFIVLTADATPEAERESLQAGAHAVLCKPVVVARLLDAVVSATGDVAAPQSIRRPGSGESLSDPAQHDVVAELRKMGLGEQFVQTFLEECVRDARRCLVLVRSTAEGGRWDACRDALHALKGAAGNMGAWRLSALAEAGMRAGNIELRNGWPRQIAELERALSEALTMLAVQHVALRTDDARD